MTFLSAIKLLKPYRRQILFIMSLALMVSGISAITPFISRSIIDDGLLTKNTRIVVNMVLLLTALQIIGQFVEYLQRVQEINIINHLGMKLKVDAFDHGLMLKPEYFKEHGFYKTISNALYDISCIMSIVNNSFLIIFVIICKSLGAFVGLIILDWRLSIFVLIILPTKLILNSIIRNHAEKRSKQLMDDNKNYNKWLSSILSGIVDIKLWGLRKKFTSEYTKHVKTINESSKKLSLLKAKNDLFAVCFGFLTANTLYILGALMITNDTLTLGGLIAFITFTAYVLSPVDIIMDIRIILKQITPSVEGYKRFINLEKENYDSIPLEIEKISTIEFKNVSVAFGNRKILKNFNLIINRGEKLVILGDNASGKTTIVNLLLRMHKQDSGDILIDGKPISDFNVDSYRSKFSVVSQDPHIFDGSVGYNITFDDNKAVDFSADERLRFCTEVIDSMDNHYDTLVGSEGAKLSGGEKQKIALLRALYRKSGILVLDEPTSNYDIESDAEFNKFILNDRDFDFHLIISHRKGILPNVDKVLTLENGVIREDI